MAPIALLESIAYISDSKFIILVVAGVMSSRSFRIVHNLLASLAKNSFVTPTLDFTTDSKLSDAAILTSSAESSSLVNEQVKFWDCSLQLRELHCAPNHKSWY